MSVELLVLAGALVLGPSAAVLVARATTRDARIMRARRRDARRVERARRAADRERQLIARMVSRGEWRGQVRVPNAPPIPVRDRVPDPPPRGRRGARDG